MDLGVKLSLMLLLNINLIYVYKFSNYSLPLSDGNRKCFAKLSNFKKNLRKKHLEISKLQRAVNIFIGIPRYTNTLVVSGGDAN